MNAWMEYEPLLRLVPFVGIFAVMVVWELYRPRRPLDAPKAYRWLNNLGLVMVNSLVLRLLFPGAAVGVALLAEQQQWGLFHLTGISSAWPLITCVLALVLLDGLIWAQHWLFHHVPLLWRLHRLHHADVDLDVTSGLRFHPLEILLSMLIKASMITVLGVPVLAVLVFEIWLNAMAMFNHANIRLPQQLDAKLRWLVVTPDMHRVHHSWHADETNSNFGFNLSCWDRWFGTYRAQPRDGHESMILGLPHFRHLRDTRLDRLLAQPFVR